MGTDLGKSTKAQATPKVLVGPLANWDIVKDHCQFDSSSTGISDGEDVYKAAGVPRKLWTYGRTLPPAAIVQNTDEAADQLRSLCMALL